jgi:hypothetical protein
MDRSLSDAQIEYYSRQILLRELGGVGQKRFLDACVSSPEAETRSPSRRPTSPERASAGSISSAANPRAIDRGAPFAPLDDRNPDVRLRRLDATPPRLDDYDAAIVTAPAASLLRTASGRPRRGEVGIELLHDGGVAVVVVPAASGSCALCARAASEPAPLGAAPRPARSGWLARSHALAVCRWIAGLAPRRRCSRRRSPRRGDLHERGARDRALVRSRLPLREPLVTVSALARAPHGATPSTKKDLP